MPRYLQPLVETVELHHHRPAARPHPGRVRLLGAAAGLRAQGARARGRRVRQARGGAVPAGAAAAGAGGTRRLSAECRRCISWGAGTRTPITSSRGWRLAIRRPPKGVTEDSQGSGHGLVGPVAVQARVGAVRPPAARRACPARRCARRRAPRCGPRPGWWIAGGRSRARCGRRGAAAGHARSAHSVRTSTLEVASSRISMRGSAAAARAKATSWRCPAERWPPRSPTSVS